MAPREPGPRNVRGPDGQGRPMLRTFGAKGQAREQGYGHGPTAAAGLGGGTYPLQSRDEPRRTTCQCRRRRRAVRCRIARTLRDRCVDLRGRARRRSRAEIDRRCPRGARALPGRARAGAAARRRQLAMRADRRRGARDRSQQASVRDRRVRSRRDDGRRRARGRARLAQCVVEAARAVVPRRREHVGAGDDWAAWPATTRAARARSPTATWCTTCTRSMRSWRTAPKRASAPRPRWRQRARGSPSSCGACARWASASAAKSSATCRRCCVASAATTSTSAARRASGRTRRTAASTTRISWSAAKARSRGRAGSR